MLASAAVNGGCAGGDESVRDERDEQDGRNG